MKRQTILDKVEAQILEEVDIESRLVEIDIGGTTKLANGSALVEFSPTCDYFCEQKVRECSVFNSKGDFLPHVSKYIQSQIENYVETLNSESQEEWFRDSTYKQRKNMADELNYEL